MKRSTVMAKWKAIAGMATRILMLTETDDGEQPNHGSTIFYHGPRADRFVATFRDVGDFISGGAINGVGETRGGSMREIEGVRRRTISRPLTPEGRAEREAYVARGCVEPKAYDKAKRELEADTFSWASQTKIIADDDKLEIVYVDKHGVELWRRPQTLSERNLELPFGDSKCA